MNTSLGKIVFATTIVCLVVMSANAQTSTAPEPAPRSAGANLLQHIQARDAILRQVGHVSSIEDALVAQSQDFRMLFQGDFMPTQRAVLANIDSEVIRTNDFQTQARNASNEAERLRLLVAFDGRFPPRIPGIGSGTESFLARLASLRRLVESGARSESDGLRRASIAFQAEIGVFHSLFRTHFDQVADILQTNPTFFYELIGRTSFAAMNDLPSIEQAVQHHLRKLGELRQGITQPSPELVERRTALSRQYDGFLNEVRKLLQDLDRQRVRSEALTVEQAEQGFGKNVSEKSFNVLLIVFGLCFLMLFLGPMLYKNASTDTIAAQILTGPFILQFSTVFILCASIVLLGIGGFIKEDQLPVLLAGISGYVLGQLGSAGRGTDNTTTPR